MQLTKEEISKYIEVTDVKYDTPKGITVSVEDVIENDRLVMGVYNIRLEKNSSISPDKLYSKVFLIDAEYNDLDKIYLIYRYTVEEMLVRIMKDEGTTDGKKFSLDTLHYEISDKFDKEVRLRMVNKITEDISLGEYHKLISMGVTKFEWVTNVLDHVDSNYPANRKYHRIEVKIQCLDEEKREYDYLHVFVVEASVSVKVIRTNIESMFTQFVHAYSKLKKVIKK